MKLAQHPNIHGVKEASPDPKQWEIIGKEKPDGFELISGDDVSTVDIIRFGGCGVISVMANAFPEIMCSVVNLALQQQFHEAERALDLLTDINPLMYQESNPVGVKKALNLLGICEPTVRLPLVEASDTLTNAISEAMPTSSIATKKP